MNIYDRRNYFLVLEQAKKDYSYAQTVLDTLSKCKCCPRHNYYKPTFFQRWTELQPNTNTNDKLKYCDCTCRHLSRQICRLCKEEPEEIYAPIVSKIQRPHRSPPKVRPHTKLTDLLNNYFN